MDIEDCWNLRPGLWGVLDALRITAAFLGYFLCGIGWLIFVCNLAGGNAEMYRLAGWFIVPGWLLLRFASGLFPFGRRIVRLMR